MKKRIIIFAIGIVCMFGFAGSVSATHTSSTLMDRGGGMIYDADLNVTWLQDANYAQTSGYDADGKMTWDQWIVWFLEGLMIGDCPRR